LSFLHYFAFCFNHLIKSAQNIINGEFLLGFLHGILGAFVYGVESGEMREKREKRQKERRHKGGGKSFGGRWQRSPTIKSHL